MYTVHYLVHRSKAVVNVMGMESEYMKRKKFAKAAVLCICILGIVAVVTFAVSMNSEEVDNRFTYGNVSILLTEVNFNNPANEAKKVMTPLSKVDKDPVIVNNGKNDAVVFLKVEIPKAEVDVVDETTNRVITPKESRQLFDMITTYQVQKVVDGETQTVEEDCKQVREENWKLISKDDTSAEKVTYIYGYNKVLKVNKNVEGDTDYMTSPLFDKIQLINILETDLATLPKNVGNINVYAYAIQADNILINNQKVTDIELQSYDEDTGVYENLREIYQKYVNNN